MYILNTENTDKNALSYFSFPKLTSFASAMLRKTVNAIILTQTPSRDGRENPLLIKREASFINKDWNDSRKQLLKRNVKSAIQNVKYFH